MQHSLPPSLTHTLTNTHLLKSKVAAVTRALRALEPILLRENVLVVAAGLAKSSATRAAVVLAARHCKGPQAAIALLGMLLPHWRVCLAACVQV